MHTKILDIYDEQRRWQLWHHATFEHDKETGRVLQAIYDAPTEKRKNHIRPNCTVLVPDMDYYNTLTNELEIKNAIEEIFGDANNI